MDGVVVFLFISGFPGMMDNIGDFLVFFPCSAFLLLTEWGNGCKL